MIEFLYLSAIWQNYEYLIMNSGEKIPASELILHEDGSIYHLNIKPGNLADTIILVGDPQRVEMISNYFDDIEFKGANREIVTHTGTLNKKRLTVLSTGMGTDNIDIVLNELDALVNVDLEKKIIKPEHTTLNIIRLGTSGGIQADLPLNSFVLSEYGLGLDGLLSFYKNSDKVIDQDLTNAFIQYANFPQNLPQPYLVESSDKLSGLFVDEVVRGITATAPGFYGPQGRRIRLDGAVPDIIDRLQNFEFNGKRVQNLEMETSALFGLSKMLGHEALTICVAIANRHHHGFSPDYKTAVKRLVELVLEKIT